MLRMIWIGVLTVCGSGAVALAAPPAGGLDASLLEGTPLEVLAPYIGDWEVEGEWGDGRSLWSRNEYRVMMGGAFVAATTWAADGGGEPYQRYFTVYTAEDGGIVARGFTHDGTTSTLEMTTTEDSALVAEWGESPARIRQRVDPPRGDAYRWRVWMLRDPDAEAVELIDAIWRRASTDRGTAKCQGMNAPPSGPYPIDASLFVGDGSRSITKEAEFGAVKRDAFEHFSTEEGLRRLFGISSRIDLAVGGAYEWYFLDDSPYGTKGGEGNQVLAFIPDRLLVFSWNAPPTQPESRAKRTWVVLEFADRGEGACSARLTHLGFGEGAKWDETYAYFDAAWERVLTAAARAVE